MKKWLWSLSIAGLLLIVIAFGWMDHAGDKTHKIVLTALTQLPQALQQLFTKLKKDKFVIKQVDRAEVLRFGNYGTKEHYVFSGTGVQNYYIRRPIAIQGNIYPDFSLTVLTLETPDTARNYASQIALATPFTIWYTPPRAQLTSGY